MRTIVLGVPRSGKTTYAQNFAVNSNRRVISTDDFIEEYPWKERAIYIAGLIFSLEPPWIIEGCDAVRGLRKFLALYPDRKPADKIVWLGSPRIPLNPRQTGFGKGLRTIFEEDIQPHLIALDVKMEIVL